MRKPDGVFWWSFYTNSGVDEFSEAAPEYASGGQVDSRDDPSTNAKIHLIVAVLSTGRYLSILDGLEIIKEQKGDRCGFLRSGDLRDFLTYFAVSGHQSFCLIIIRVPVLDLTEYTIFEMDICVAIAWAYLAEDKCYRAREDSKRTQ